MMIDINTDSVSVPMITASDIHECEEKNSSTGEKAHSNILIPIKNRIKLTPCLRKRNIPIIPLRAKNNDISPITAKTLEVTAKKFSSDAESMPEPPSLMTPMMAGMESTANR